MTELNIVGGNHVEIPFYTPLVNDGTKEKFWSKDPSVYFTGGHASMHSFYDTVNQGRLLKYIKKKADNMRHKKLGRLDNVNDLERALTEYYNVAKKSIVRIDEPANDVEWSTIKFLLDASRFLLLNGLLTAKQYIPIQAESGIHSDEKCLENYLNKTLKDLSDLVYKLTNTIANYIVLKVPRGNTKLHTNTAAVTFCTRIQVNAKCLMDLQEKSCEDILSLDDTGVSQFERLQLPEGILVVENNDICHIFTDENRIIGTENQCEYFGAIHPDVIYSGTKTSIQTKDADAKEKSKTQSVGERARSNRVRVGRAARRKKMDMESRADKMILYGPGMKMEEIAIRTKYLMELRDLEIDVEDIDEMERKENFLIDKDPLTCFHMIQVSELLPPGSVGGGRTKQWDIPTTPRVNIKVGKVYTNQEVVRAGEFFIEAYKELVRIYKGYGNPEAVQEINYQGSFKMDNNDIAHLYISRSDGHFSKTVFNPPGITGLDKDKKCSTTTKSQTCPSPREGTINRSANIELKQQPESITVSTSLPSILPLQASGVEAKTPIGFQDTSVEKTNEEVDSTLPLTTPESRNTTSTVIESNIVDQNHETKDTDASGNIGTNQKTATESNTIDVEVKDNNKIDNSRVTRMQTNRETISVPAIPNPAKGRDTASIDTTQEIDEKESEQQIRRSTRKRSSPDKFSECSIYNTRKQRTIENETEHNAHNPTCKRKLPMRRHKTGVDLQSCEEMEAGKELPDVCETQEPLSNKGCSSDDTTKCDKIDNNTVSNVVANGKITKKCDVGMCPGYSCDYVACMQCERLVHKNDHCSILRSLPNIHTNGLLVHRVCVDCYKLNNAK